MNLSKNGRKTQKAICKALMLGLPVAGLLATAGCGKGKEDKMIPVRSDDQRYHRRMGDIDPRCLEDIDPRCLEEARRKAEAEAIRRSRKGGDEAAKNSSLP